METIKLNWPTDAGELSRLHSGDVVSFSGTVYTARDAAHRRLVELLAQGQQPPFPLSNAAIYYAGPSPTPPGQACGSIGPTTASRMDSYKETLLEQGVKLMIGKGSCMPELSDLCARYGAVYLAAPGGVAALTASHIKSAQLIAWEDLGAEAVQQLEVEDMLLVVINDSQGHDYYREK